MTRRAAIAAALLLAAVVGWGSIGRVPEGALAVRGGEVLGPGYHLKRPFAAFPTVAVSGAASLAGLEIGTPEGSRYPVALTVGYRLDASRLGGDVRALESGDVAAYLRPAVESVLAAAGAGFSPEALLSGVPFADRIRADLEAALARRGVEVESLDASVEIPEGVVESVRRREVEAAFRPTGERLLIVGWDGADWQTADRLMAAGRMPNLARLVREGVRADLRSYDPMMSPLLWTTMATGYGPDRHGIADFLAFDEKAGRRVPISARFRKVKALWNILTDVGLKSGFVGWWGTHPAEPVSGVLASDVTVFATTVHPPGEPVPAGVAYPDGYLDGLRARMVRPGDVTLDDVRRFAPISPEEHAEARRAIEADPSLGVEERMAAGGRGVIKRGAGGDAEVPRAPVPFLLKLVAQTRNYQTIALDLLHRGDLDVVSVYFGAIDQSGHNFQHLMPPRHPLAPDGEFPRFSGVIDAVYAWQDELLGELVRAAAGRYTVMVVSDHGFRTGNERPRDKLPFASKQPVEWHRELGILVLHGGPARRGARIERAGLFDVAPTVLHLLGLPRAEDMTGRPLVGALRDDFVAAHPPATIGSFEGFGSGPLRGDAAGGGIDAAQAEMLADLAALGYVAVGDVAPAEEGGGEAAAGGGGERTNVTYHRNMATYYMNQGRYAEAEVELRRANEIEKLPKTYTMLAECLAAQGRRADAAAALDEGFAAVPRAMSPTSVLYMVEMRLLEGDLDGARRDAGRHRERLAAAPALAPAVEGRLAEADGDLPRAEGLYRQALALDPTLVQVALRLWPLLEARGAGGDLAPVVEAALAREERIDEYHNIRGVLRLRAGDLEGAIASFRRAAFLTPESDQFQGNLGLALLRAGRKDEALAAYREAAAGGSHDPRIHANLGVLLAEAGDWRASLAAYERALELGADFPQAIIGRSTALARLGREEEARQVAREGARRFPADPTLQRLAR